MAIETYTQHSLEKCVRAYVCVCVLLLVDCFVFSSLHAPLHRQCHYIPFRSSLISFSSHKASCDQLLVNVNANVNASANANVEREF